MVDVANAELSIEFVVHLRGQRDDFSVFADAVERTPDGRGLVFREAGKVVFVLPDEADLAGLGCAAGVDDEALSAVGAFASPQGGANPD